MPISEATIIGAVGNTTNAASYSAGPITPTALRILMLFVVCSGSAVPLEVGGTLAAPWEPLVDSDILGVGGRRLGVWVANTGDSGIGGGTIVITAPGQSFTGSVIFVTEINGAYRITGQPALDAFYGVNNPGGDVTSTSTQTPPGVAYAAAGDATMSVLVNNLNVALTTERTKIADAGYSTPTQRLGAQWFLGNDSDGPLFSWVGSAVARAITWYIRDLNNPPPPSTFKQSVVTTSV